MNIVVIGAQWGDEGKGKIVDYLSENAEIVVRYSGGANAGHTIVIDDATYKLHLVPSGVINPEKMAILGTAMVIDPESLFKELSTLKSQGINWEGRVLISDRSHIVLPRYKEEDIEMEQHRPRPIGTTGRGIGSTYARKAHREGYRIVDLFDPGFLEKVPQSDRDFISPYLERLEKMSIHLPGYMKQQKGKNVLFEGAQGILLDPDMGTYPFVSSGISCAAGASIGGGIGPRDLHRILGVFKAYTTRVGNGPFPSEFSEDDQGEMIDMIRDLGREYGVTTGRPRRCGYLDLLALSYACDTNSLDALVLTHLDVYDQLDEVAVCIAYEYQGKRLESFPSSIEVLEQAKPILKTFPGWKQDLSEIMNYEDLPGEAKDYIDFIEEFTGTPIDIISVGYQRKSTITRRNQWIKS